MNKWKSTELESSLQFRAFFRLYAFGFGLFLVTGLQFPQLPLFFALSAFFSFFESFSYGMNLFITNTSWFIILIRIPHVSSTSSAPLVLSEA